MRALGIDLGGTKLEAVLLAAEGQELWRQRIATPAGDYDATLRAIAALVAQARAAGGGGCSVGLGTPGSLTPEGLMKNANSQCLNGRALQADQERLLGQPLRLANDANCLALSEATDGNFQRLVDQSVVRAGTLAKRFSVNEGLESRAGLATRLLHMVEGILLEVAAADPGLDMAVARIDCQEADLYLRLLPVQRPQEVLVGLKVLHRLFGRPAFGNGGAVLG